MTIFLKDPEAKLDYSVDWIDWLESGEVIVTSTWTVPSGITKDSDSNSDSAATIWLLGGTAGEEYKVVNHVVTDTPREDDRMLTIKVRNR